ncbi:MAG: thiol oxidoreductase [Myxococcota bacterium]|nr:thiol oxidoreductase [Myxococcota bacterium]
MSLTPYLLLAGALAGCETDAPADESNEPSSATEQGLHNAMEGIGEEVSIARHLQDGQEFQLSLRHLIAHGKNLFDAVWTTQEGGGRPFSKGTGDPLADQTSPLVFPRNFNRLSAPDSNSCTSCHNEPRDGGGGHIVANAFLPVQRFDFVTFDHTDPVPTRGAVDESNKFVTLDNVGNSTATISMFGAGYIEMLARQMTQELQAQRDSLQPGGSIALVAKGITFGTLARSYDGTWNVSGVQGLPMASTKTTGAADRPSLIIQPFHQSGNVISIRQFTNNAFNHHHGVQSTERFGVGEDPDGDGFVDELTRADVTAAAIFQATLPVPGRVIPHHPAREAAIWLGEQTFDSIGCTSCHVASLPLTNAGWVFTEPGPFNPSGNLQPGQAPTFTVNLNDPQLPGPRLRKSGNVVRVPAYTDLKLHDITTGPGDPNRDAINFGAPAGSPEFFAGNGRFLTKKLWGVANEPPFFHHGKFTTMREAILAHHGEAEAQGQAFANLSPHKQKAVIEFLKSLQVLPPNSPSRIVDEHGNPRHWPPN